MVCSWIFDNNTDSSDSVKTKPKEKKRKKTGISGIYIRYPKLG